MQHASESGEGGGVQGLVGDDSDQQTHHKSPDQPVKKLICNSQVSTSKGQ